MFTVKTTCTETISSMLKLLFPQAEIKTSENIQEDKNFHNLLQTLVKVAPALESLARDVKFVYVSYTDMTLILEGFGSAYFYICVYMLVIPSCWFPASLGLHRSSAGLLPGTHTPAHPREHEGKG